MPVMGIHPCEKSWFHGRESGSRVLTMNSFLPWQKTGCVAGELTERERRVKRAREVRVLESEREGDEERNHVARANSFE